MFTIRVCSAMAATYLSVGISAVLLSVNSFGDVIPEGPYGVALLLVTSSTLLTAVTSASPARYPLNSLLILLSTVWMSLGITKIWTAIKRHNGGDIPVNNEHLIPGYGSSASIMLLFLLVSVFRKPYRIVSLLATLCTVLFIFEIVGIFNIWYKVGPGPIYITLVLILAFQWILNSLHGFYGKNKVDGSDNASQDNKTSRFDVLYYGLSAMSYSTFGWHLTTISKVTQYAFSLPISSGLYLFVLGVSALKLHNFICGAHMITFGVIWFALGSNLWIEDYIHEFFSIPVPASVILGVFLILLAVLNIKYEICRSINCLIMYLLILSLTLYGDKSTFSGTVAAIGFFWSLYGAAAHLTRLFEFRIKFPLGISIFEKAFLNKVISNMRSCNAKVNPSDKSTSIISADLMLGFSKYADVQSLSFLLNAVTALVLIPESSEYSVHTLPFCIGFGGILQCVVGYIAFSRGLTFESSYNLIFASFWTIWGTVRILHLSDNSIQSGCISFLFISIVLGCLSATINVVWLCTSASFSLVVISFLVSGLTYGEGSRIYHIVVTSIFSAIQIYGFLSCFSARVLGRGILPSGKPLINVNYLQQSIDKTVLADARKASGVRQIADLMNSGKICGVPSDTVYILVAACNQPDAVERAYKCKNSAEDRPMSVWISSLKQIDSAKEEFGPILWEFLQEIWPSNISVVLNRGAWTNSLGLGDSGKYVGKPDSIAIRIPDCSIICHLIDQTGPIVVTSANPTGEADTTHHWQVLSKLGSKNCDGVLCDGPSPENAASTVVDCREAAKGKLTFFRIGLSPKSKVEEILEKVLQRHKQTSDRASDSGISI